MSLPGLIVKPVKGKQFFVGTTFCNVSVFQDDDFVCMTAVSYTHLDVYKRQGQLGDSGYFSENGYVDREPQKEELQRVKQPACGDRSDADWQSTDSDPEDDSSAARRKQSPVWLWILLIVFAAPVVLPIVFGLLVAAISVLFALFITGIALLVCGIVCTGAGIWALIQAFTQIVAWPAAAMIGIGISLAAIGIGVLVTLLMGWLIGKVVPTGVRALCNCLHRIVTRKGGRAV